MFDPDEAVEAAGNTLAGLAEARWRAEAVAIAGAIEWARWWAEVWRPILPASERK